ncbi:MAG: DUF1648 domain-containing protein [Clostridiales bacterium]|jgi:uncharacterized membrane protein|nr:DUF1648 domain-containing protein [Clostridiales bacterium]
MKQKIKMVNKIFWVFPAVGMVVAAVAYPFLPQQLVTHWDFSGQPDQTMHKAFLFVIPLVLAFCVFVFTWLPARDPKGKNYAKFQKENTILQVLFFLILLGAEIITIVYGLGSPVNVKVIVSLALGGFFVILGNLLPKFKPTAFTGIRTPWTRKNPDVWTKTHRVGGKIFMASGACIMAAGLVPTGWSIALFVVAIAAMMVVPLVYSYVAFRKENEGKN